MYLSLSLVMASLRRIYGLGETGRMRRRQRRVASYLSVLLPMQVFLLGLALGLMRADDTFAVGPLAALAEWLGEQGVQVTCIVLAASRRDCICGRRCR